MVTATERITAAEFREHHSNTHVELIDGRVVVTSPGQSHQRVAIRMIVALEQWSGSRSASTLLFEFDTDIGPHDVFKPDVAWYASDSDDLGERRPDLVIEVRSPSTWRFDIGRKLRRYEDSGVPEAWFVDTEARVVLVYRRSKPAAAAFDVALELTAQETLTSPLLPELTLPVASLFAG